MFQQKFIGRKKELAFLEQLYQEQKAQLVIFYGRRRVGKTELIRQFIKDKPHIIYSNSAIPSLFQKSWDLYLANKNIMLILLGSSVRMMETQVLGSASPLY